MMDTAETDPTVRTASWHRSQVHRTRSATGTHGFTSKTHGVENVLFPTADTCNKTCPN